MCEATALKRQGYQSNFNYSETAGSRTRKDGVNYAKSNPIRLF